MLGLRTQEDSRFLVFFKTIQEEAKKENAVFFLNCGEGHSVFEEDIICTDCSGWLIPAEKATAFEKEFLDFKEDVQWDVFTTWATWERKASKLQIKFQRL